MNQKSMLETALRRQKRTVRAADRRIWNIWDFMLLLSPSCRGTWLARLSRQV